MKKRYTRKQITEAIAYWTKVLNEGFGGYDIEQLRGHSYEEFVGKKNPPSYERWEAAQLPDPEEDIHGELPSAEIIEYPGARDYLKKWQIHGIYPDGEVFNLGPYSRAICSEYMSLHKLSKNSRTYQKMKDAGFDMIRTYDIDPHDEELKQIYDVVKLPNGFFLKILGGSTKIGPFDNKQLARMYALAQGIELQKSSKGDGKVDQEYHINYPTWVFTCTVRGIPYADIVVAEDEASAMKLFDFQWHVFDGSRPIRTKFNSLEELKRDLSLMMVKDIKMIPIDDGNAEEMFDLVDQTGNMSNKPELMKWCKNPKYRYILGRDMKTGRSPVKIYW